MAKVRLLQGKPLMRSGKVALSDACCCGAHGACCIGTACSVHTFTDCTSLGGIYSGDGTTCSDVPYLCGGACCNPDTGACVIAPESNCDNAGWDYKGDSTSCDPSPCKGGCCHGTGDVDCDITEPEDCDGIFLGGGAGCGDFDHDPCCCSAHSDILVEVVGTGTVLCSTAFGDFSMDCSISASQVVPFVSCDEPFSFEFSDCCTDCDCGAFDCVDGEFRTALRAISVTGDCSGVSVTASVGCSGCAGSFPCEACSGISVEFGVSAGGPGVCGTGVTLSYPGGTQTCSDGPTASLCAGLPGTSSDTFSLTVTITPV